jgi:hypothetical protein
MEQRSPLELVFLKRKHLFGLVFVVPGFRAPRRGNVRCKGTRAIFRILLGQPARTKNLTADVSYLVACSLSCDVLFFATREKT